MNFIQKQRFLLLDPKKNPETQGGGNTETEQEQKTKEKIQLPEGKKKQVTKKTKQDTQTFNNDVVETLPAPKVIMGLEQLGESESEVFNRVINTKISDVISTKDIPTELQKYSGGNVFKLFIGQIFEKKGIKLGKYKGVSEVILFNKILSKVSPGSVIGNIFAELGKGLIPNSFGEKKGKQDTDIMKNFKQAFSDLDLMAQGEKVLSNTVEFPFYQNAQKKEMKTPIMVPESVLLLAQELESIVDTDTTNIKKLLILGNKENVNNYAFKSLLSNPTVLEVVLDKGEYSENGYDINISQGKLILPEKNKSTQPGQKEYMQKTLEAIKKTGQPIDNIIEGGRGFIEVFGMIGINEKQIKNMLEGFSDNSFFGGMIKLLLSFLFPDGLEEDFDILSLEKDVQKSIQQLQKFTHDIGDKKELPFIPNPEKQAGIKNNIVTFLNNIQGVEIKKERTVKVGPRKTIRRTMTEKSMIEKPHFWKDILTGTNHNTPLIAKIQTEIKKIRTDTPTISEQEFYRKLSKLDLKQEHGKKQPKQEISKPVEQAVVEKMPEDKPEAIAVIASVPVIIDTKIKQTEEKPREEKKKVPKQEEKNTPKQKIKPPVKPEQEVVLKNKTIGEQVVMIKSLPHPIKYNNKEYSLNIVNNNITLGDKTFGIDIKADSMLVLGNQFENIQFIKGKFYVNYSDLEDNEAMDNKTLSGILVSLIEGNKAEYHGVKEDNTLGIITKHPFTATITQIA